ncbi:metalloregulator ArsR/SmtB family transcription factor [Asticcacaulis sp. EMRT-3]|uniref:ArsR/SmtB family transcription factor n=1 Tax=Asticcacaulis sp. EMRT-3 TaxID=3040349 RepID=UPI0024AF1A3A|nr:metalloregulator ArsR/SmtB family transcription factor [Asticcacaulis sp. EMRT-3]MDI7773769.1 metalloregulator ArsR/SmtB family transcription factor [Asticcacaulis sp. EMRT-3]
MANASLPKTSFPTLLEALKAAGEATRLRLLRLLAHEELSVMELVLILGQSQPRISRHLKLMNEAGLIERFPDGAWVFYRLSASPAIRPLVDAILDRLDKSMAEDLDHLETVRRTRRNSAEGYFETIAPKWDEIRSHYISEDDVEKAILHTLGDAPCQALIDLGTGSGRMLTLLGGRAKTATGVDLSQHMLNIARAKTFEAGLSHIDLRHGDIYDTRLPGQSADLVIVHQVLHFLADPGRAILEAGRLLRPGGRLLIADFAHHTLEIMREQYQHRRLGMLDEDMQAWLKQAGLTPGVSVGLPPRTQGGLTVKIWLAHKPA